jgi:hypothetical protein
MAQSAERVFHFVNDPGVRGLQEIVTVLRTAGNIQQVSLDAPSAALSVAGTPGQIAAAEWIIHQLDQPERTPASSPQNESVTFGGDVYVVYYLKHATIPMGVQEVVTTLRAVGNVQRIYSYGAPAAVVMRGPAPEMAMAGWLIQQLDVPAADPPASQREYTNPDAAGDPVHVFYLPPAATKEELQQMVTAIRTTGQIQHVYACLDARAIAVRDTPARVALAGRLIEGWAKPSKLE